MFELMSDIFPDLSDGKLVHEKCEIGVKWNDSTGGAKMVLFKVDDIKNIEYRPGAHSVAIQTKLQYKSLNNTGLKSFHIKYIDYNYCLEKNKKAQIRRSEEDRRRGYGIQYESLSKDDKFKVMWNFRKSKAIKTIDYINNSNDDKKYEQQKINWIKI
jgi:hypothetical protein